jgi:hypothetical protein
LYNLNGEDIILLLFTICIHLPATQIEHVTSLSLSALKRFADLIEMRRMGGWAHITQAGLSASYCSVAIDYRYMQQRQHERVDQYVPQTRIERMIHR